MQKFSLKKISEVINAPLINKNIGNLSHILTDSRNLNVNNSSECIFFAIDGIQHDGHNFIGSLYDAGVKAFVISKDIDFIKYPDAGFVKVTNTVSALQKLAHFKRMQFLIPVIGITGSNGKTIVKEWLYWLLMDKFNTVRSPQSYNSKIGVPLSLWLLENKTEMGIFEAGISMPGEMENLEKIIKPTIGILTNIGNAHQQNFKNEKHKITEKLKLFKNVEKIVYCADNEEVRKQIDKLPANPEKISWSFKNSGNVNVENIIYQNKSTKIILNYNKKNIEIEIPFTDKGSVENAINCFCLLLAIEKSADKKILEKFKKLPGIAMRLEILDGINNSTLINDSYNSDINSLKIALDFLSQKKGNKKSVIILSDILQNSEDEEKLYSEVSKLIKSKDISKLVGIGPALYNNRNLFGSGSSFYLSTSEFIEKFNSRSFSDACILLKGARSFEFEKISYKLQQKLHDTVMEIDFNAMKQNLDFFKSCVKSSVKLMAVVKAFSYGSGYQEIALFLQHNRVDYLAVAYIDEGIELREHGIRIPIMVMNPGKNSVSILTDNDLEPEIYSIALLEHFAAELEKSPLKSLSVHLKFDTGMHRLGIKPEEINMAAEIIKKSGKFNIKSIFSHLKASEKPEFDNISINQIKVFEQMYSNLTEILNIQPLKHILNSGGIVRFPQYHFDMVRLGIGLYGITPEISNFLVPVSTFKTVISQIHNLKKNETVSYNGSGKLEQDSVIATIPVGYADGLDRRLGNGNWYVIINNKKAPTVGDICMDMTMIDITDMDAPEGSEVIIFGDKNTVFEMSRKLNTIPYEIITGISERVKRVYIQE